MYNIRKNIMLILNEVNKNTCLPSNDYEGLSKPQGFTETIYLNHIF